MRGEAVVQLKTGHSFRGRIKRTRGEELTLGVGTGEITFNLADITILDFEDPEYRTLQELPKASVILTNGQRLRGRLVKEDDELVVLAFGSGRLTVRREDVSAVSFVGRVHF